jgi:hypothetical protein
MVTVHLEQRVGIAILANDTEPASEALVKEIALYLVQNAQAWADESVAQ